MNRTQQNWGRLLAAAPPELVAVLKLLVDRPPSPENRFRARIRETVFEFNGYRITVSARVVTLSGEPVEPEPPDPAAIADTEAKLQARWDSLPLPELPPIPEFPLIPELPDVLPIPPVEYRNGGDPCSG